MKVRIVENIADELREWSENSAPLETGGILVGVFTGADPWITHAFLVETDARSGTRYELPGGVTQELVRLARRNDPRVGYLGDWHSHPADVGPSITDLGSLRRLARLATGRGHRPPIILVVRRGSDRWTLDARVGMRWPFGSRGTDVLLTGPPTTPEPRASAVTGSPPVTRKRKGPARRRQGAE